jgi:hypothetical protein
VRRRARRRCSRSMFRQHEHADEENRQRTSKTRIPKLHTSEAVEYFLNLYAFATVNRVRWHPSCKPREESSESAPCRPRTGSIFAASEMSEQAKKAAHVSSSRFLERPKSLILQTRSLLTRTLRVARSCAASHISCTRGGRHTRCT